MSYRGEPTQLCDRCNELTPHLVMVADTTPEHLCRDCFPDRDRWDAAVEMGWPESNDDMDYWVADGLPEVFHGYNPLGLYLGIVQVG